MGARALVLVTLLAVAGCGTTADSAVTRAVANADEPTSTTSDHATTTTAVPTSTTEAPATTTTTVPPTPTTTEPSDAAQGTEPPGRVLMGRTFMSVNVTEDGQPRELVTGTRITVSFRDEGDRQVVAWNSGCNYSGASVVITLDRLEMVDLGSSSTRGCDEPRHQQDEWLVDFFHANPQWNAEGSDLVLMVGDTRIDLVAEES